MIAPFRSVGQAATAFAACRLVHAVVRQSVVGGALKKVALAIKDA